MLELLEAWLIAPFDYGFMQRAFVAGLALSLAAPPLGVFLMLRGMSLIGDAMSHAILPGVALGFLFAGFSLPISRRPRSLRLPRPTRARVPCSVPPPCGYGSASVRSGRRG